MEEEMWEVRCQAGWSHEKLLWLYDRMTMIRKFEEYVLQIAHGGAPVGPVHLYIGQEAVAVGVCAALEGSDYIASTHRGHGHCIAKGVDIRRMMAEIFGKSTGTNRGKGGSMHITDVSVGMLGVNPIIGVGPTHAVGAALSAKLRRSGQVVAAFFGDGATGIGFIHEAFNMASIWSLPLVFVCENNGYAQSTPVEYAVAAKNVADLAGGYGMPGVVVDGQDVFCVWEAAENAVRRARANGGPSLIECKTYRYCGHNQADDPHRYRSIEEEEAALARDCIRRFRDRVTSEGLLSADKLDAIDQRNGNLLKEAVAFAEASPLPDLKELYTEVYATPSLGELNAQ
jgi:acetoin:2,6-dichlorophenolindophenol oxidoreductase subunit alpha